MKAMAVNPNDQINFLPEWYIQAQRQRAARRRQIVLIAMMMAGMACLWMLTNRRSHAMEDYLASLKSQITAANGQITEVGKLQEERKRLSRQVRIYRQIAQPITYSQITGTLAEHTPAAISLSELFAHTEIVEEARGSETPHTKGRAKPRTVRYPVVVVEAQGSAPSNVDIANFVGRLAGSGLFRNVQMINSREGEVGKLSVRRFKVTMQVPLNVVYRQPVAEEVAHAD